MAWPEKLTEVKSNLNTTELWMLKEQMDSNCYNCKLVSMFDEYSEFIVEVHGEKYRFTEWHETVSSVDSIGDTK